MENFAQNYIKFDIFGTFLFKKGVNPKSLVAALALCPGKWRKTIQSEPV